MIKLTQKDEALQREWDLEDDARARRRLIIYDKLFHDVPRQETTSPDRKSEPSFELEEGKWIKELSGSPIDDPVQRDVDTGTGPATIANFRMKGDYGTVKVGLWNEQA